MVRYSLFFWLNIIVTPTLASPHLLPDLTSEELAKRNFSVCDFPLDSKTHLDWLDQLLVTVTSVLEIHQIPSWVVYGTLLNAYRDGKTHETLSDVDIQTFINHLPEICHTNGSIGMALRSKGLILTCETDQPFARVCKANASLTEPHYSLNNKGEKVYWFDTRLDRYRSSK